MHMFKKLTAALTAGFMCFSMAAGSLTNVTAADKTAVELVNDMGMGWNLGNTFDCWNTRGWTTDTETAWGNPKTSKEMIDAVHAQGFDSIRIPITWYENTNETTFDIDDAYLARVKEVVDYAYDQGMYVIINMHWDWVSQGGGNPKLWLNNGEAALPQFNAMWTEIGNYFKDYDQHLVFEDMNEVTFEYSVLNKFNQSFVDTIRKTGGNNANRLLLLAGANDDLNLTCSPEYVVPNDKMVAVSIHYYYPTPFCVASVSDKNDPNYWGYQDTWGTAADVQTVYDTFAKVKAYYADEGIPVILGEYGVVTNCGKDHNSIVKFLQTVASSALATNGVTAFLWDVSDSGDMQYYSRKQLKWLDEDYANVYKNLKTNGTPIEFEYNIKKNTETSSSATIVPTGSGEYSVDLAPFAGKGITVKQVIIKGTPGAGWGVSLPANNPDGSRRNWTSEAGQTGSDGTVTIDLDGVYEGEGGVTEPYVLSLGGSLGFQLWWGTENATIDTVTLVFDKEITYTTMDVSVTAKERTTTPTEPKPTEAPTEATEAPTEATEAPTEAIAAPTEATEAPTEATAAPTEATEAPTEATEAPTEATAAPTEATEAVPPTETNEAPTEAAEVKYGDVNGDDKVDVMDVIAVNKFVIGTKTLDEKQQKAADVDLDGNVGAADSLLILKYAVDMIHALPVAKG